MKIGNIKLENNLILAPMAGVTDLPFRLICKEMGAGLVVSEMVSAKGMYYNDEKTHELTAIEEGERPVALQIFGSDPYIMEEVVRKKLNSRDDFDIIDINMGCPAPKIVKNGDGSALMKDPKLANKVIESVVKASNKPVTVKIRMGWDMDNINGVQIAGMAEQAGVSAVTVHGRTRDMFYAGSANWEYIKKVKDSVKIPVIGNGDVFTPDDVIRMMDMTNCDGVAIGRGVMGNPWIFKRSLELINGKKNEAPGYDEVISMAIRHLELECSFKGDSMGVREMRKQLAWYLKGMRESNEVKNRINTMKDKSEIIELLLEYKYKLSKIL